MNWITEQHRDKVCDIIWWLKGFLAASKDNYYVDCPFTEDHSRALTAIAEGMREELNKREEFLKENPPFSGPYMDYDGYPIL